MQKNNGFRFPRGLTVVSLLIVLLWGIYEARPFLIPLSIAVLLALMMAPLVRIMLRYRFPEWTAIVLSSILLILPFLSFGYILVWQGGSFVRDFPKIMGAVNQAITKLIDSPMGHRFHLTNDLDIPGLIRRLEGSAIQGVQFVLAGFGAILGAGSQIALVLLFGIMMLASRNHIRSSGEKILRQTLSVENPNILDDVVSLIEQFLIARLLIVLIIAVIDFGILVLFGIPYAALMGSFLGIMTLLPAVGFLIGAIAPIIFALASGFGLLKTAALFLSLLSMSFIEGNVLTPKMVGGRLNINALTTFVGLFAGGLLWGVWGMFLSIPILGILRIIFFAAPSLRPWGELMAERESVAGEIRPPKAKKRVA